MNVGPQAGKTVQVAHPRASTSRWPTLPTGTTAKPKKGKTEPTPKLNGGGSSSGDDGL